MKPNQSIRELVAVGYMRGWLKPPAPTALTTDQLINKSRNEKRKRSEAKKVLLSPEQGSHPEARVG